MARVEQTKAQEGSSVLGRSLVEVVTPGTIRLDEDCKSSYIMTVHQQGDTLGLCFADCLAGTIHTIQIQDDEIHSSLNSLLLQLQPREVIHELGLSDKLLLKVTACCLFLDIKTLILYILGADF